MSARKLCSHVVKSANSTIFRKYFTNSKAFERQLFDHQLTPQVNHIANFRVGQDLKSQALGSLTKDQAHDLVFRLNDDERKILLVTLEHYGAVLEKDGLVCEYTC